MGQLQPESGLPEGEGRERSLQVQQTPQDSPDPRLRQQSHATDS